MNYYTADLHFFHPGLCMARGFDDMEKMNESIIKKLSFLKQTDALYIVGDIGYGYTMKKDLDAATALLNRIGCPKHLVIGNHDTYALKHRRFRQCFESINDVLLLNDSGHDLFLSHYPMVEWDGYYKGRWLFYGHIHEKRASGPSLLLDLIPTAINVGYDLAGGARTASELIEERKREWKMPDFSISDTLVPEMDPALLNGKRGILQTLSEFDNILPVKENAVL